MNIIDLLDKYNIVIPVIQRDYAHGRSDDDTKLVRDNLIETIIDVLSGNKKNVSLNYVYGVPGKDGNGKSVVELIDGQQRITTLFLMRMYLYVNSGTITSRIGFAEKFSYETRETSKNFCSALSEIELSNCLKINSESTSSRIFRQKKYYKKWGNDPTVASMLTVLDCINEKMLKLQSISPIDFAVWYDNLKNVRFEFMTLDGFKRKEELYSAMNGRGKQLTSFEQLKPAILQKYSDTKVITNIDDKINNEWIPMFWDYAKRVSGKNTTIDQELFAEENHDRFLYNYFCYIVSMLWSSMPDSAVSSKADWGKHLPPTKIAIQDLFNNRNANINRDLEFLSFAFDIFGEYFSGKPYSIKDSYDFGQDIFILSSDAKTAYQEYKNNTNSKVIISLGMKKIDIIRECCDHKEGTDFNTLSKYLLWAFLQYKWREAGKENKNCNGHSLSDYYVLARDIYANTWDTNTPRALDKNPNDVPFPKAVRAFNSIIDNTFPVALFGEERDSFSIQNESFNNATSRNVTRKLILNNPLTRGCSYNVEFVMKFGWPRQFLDNLDQLYLNAGVGSFKMLRGLDEKYRSFWCSKSSGEADKSFVPASEKMLKSLFSLRDWKNESWYTTFLMKLSTTALHDSNKIPVDGYDKWDYYLINYIKYFRNETEYSAFYAGGKDIDFETCALYGKQEKYFLIFSPFVIAAHSLLLERQRKGSYTWREAWMDINTTKQMTLKIDVSGAKPKYVWSYDGDVLICDGTKDIIQEFLDWQCPMLTTGIGGTGASSAGSSGGTSTPSVPSSTSSTASSLPATPSESSLSKESLILSIVDGCLDAQNEISFAEFISLFGNLSDDAQEEIITILKNHGISIIDEKQEEIDAITKDSDFHEYFKDSYVNPELKELSNYDLVLMAQGGNEDAKNAIIIKNQNTLNKIAYKMSELYGTSSFDTDDLFQSGALGLLEAIDKFDPEKGDNFLGYATYWIRQKMSRDAIDNGQTIRIPVHMYDKLVKLREYRKKYSNNNDDVCQYMLDDQIIRSQEEFQRLCDVMNNYSNLAALDDIESTGKPSGEKWTVWIAPEEFSETEKEVIESTMKEKIDVVLGTLTEREQQILRMRFGFEGEEKTLDEIGQMFNVTRERIRQIESKALRKLRHPNRSKCLKDFCD